MQLAERANRYRSRLLLAGLLVSSSCASHAAQTTVRARFERLAKTMPVFPIEFLNEDVEELMVDESEVADVVALTQHRDPRVRGLAIAALHMREDAHLLPHIARLISDTAKTIPVASRVLNADLRSSVRSSVVMRVEVSSRDYKGDEGEGKDWFGYPVVSRLPETVGGIARRVLQRYGIDPYKFEKYWAAYGSRAFSAGWFMAQLTGNWFSVPPPWGEHHSGPQERASRIRTVRERIDRLPRANRAWTLMWLHDVPAIGGQLVSEAELLEAAKELGPDRLLAMLRHQPFSDDPVFADGPSDGMVAFVLGHAAQLLRAEDADALIACVVAERAHSDSVFSLSPWWPVAVAQLRRVPAADALREVLTAFQGTDSSEARFTLAIGLSRAAGESQTGFLLDWLYSEPDRCGTSEYVVDRFLDVTSSPLAAWVIQDVRFDRLDWCALRTLVVAVKRWNGQSLMSDDEIQELNRTGSLSREGFPTAEAALTEVRRRLRDSMPSWLTGASKPKDAT